MRILISFPIPAPHRSHSLNLDLIGDIHGELPALQALMQELGYDPDWHHPDHRIPVFLGDLVDRGAHSLEVVERVKRLVDEDRGACLMGNHEYNLVAYALNLPGYTRPKGSNRATIESMAKALTRWAAVMPFLQSLPTAFEIPFDDPTQDLRVIHACWHQDSYEAVKGILAPKTPRGSRAGGALKEHVVLESPFADKGLKHGLDAWEVSEDVDAPHEILIKGFEVEAEEPFLDTEGTLRKMKRATWWNDPAARVLRDGKTQVFGHYWNLPPVPGPDGKLLFCPPHPSGHPKLKAWRNALLEGKDGIPATGRVAFEGNLACVDFNGVTAGSKEPNARACVGALRWPQREIVWASAKRTRSVGKHDE